MPKERVLIVFPTQWDANQLQACRPAWEERFEVELATPADGDCDWDFDIFGFMEDCLAKPGIDGVMSSSDYPGATVAGAIASGRGLPGPRPERVIACSHKYASRELQQRVVPEAVPRYELLDPENLQIPSFGFPCFVKPVKGAFSMMSGRFDSMQALRDFFERDCMRDFRMQYVHLFNQLVRRFTNLRHDGTWFLAEELLRGQQVTVEGFVGPAGIDILGIVDSETHPETGSFLCFSFPSRLPNPVQQRMHDIARRLVSASGCTQMFFNIEMIHDPASDRIGVVEVNPRLCGQFADLYEKVLGVNSYVLALELATGGTPRLPNARNVRGTHDSAASFPLRVFQPVRVERAPGEAELHAARALFPGTLIWPECGTGDVLEDFAAEDGRSCRYAVVNLGGSNRRELEERLELVLECLGYSLAPL